VRITLQTPPDFDFLSAICSHGFFVLAPNEWSPEKQILKTAITIDYQNAISVRIGQLTNNRLIVQSSASVNASQRKVIRAAARRMLRLDEDFSDFHGRCQTSGTHHEAGVKRFGRLLRSATLFEDMVKVICTCNTSWGQTVAMVDNLVHLWGVPTNEKAYGFPTPDRLANVSVDELKQQGRLGYRALYVHQLAYDVAKRKRCLDQYENFDGTGQELARQLRDIDGIGAYAAGHLCMLLGHYEVLAMDTEMVRFFQEKHPHRKVTLKTVQQYYQSWHPWQFLAYWYELWSDYVRRHGESQQWSPQITGVGITDRAR
jgi:3-methyladenine DNA glycosylase/8-oxoguanine DNA glycosylase